MVLWAEFTVVFFMFTSYPLRLSVCPLVLKRSKGFQLAKTNTFSDQVEANNSIPLQSAPASVLLLSVLSNFLFMEQELRESSSFSSSISGFLANYF